MMATRSLSVAASSMSWVVMTTVVPPALSSATFSHRNSRAAGSRPGGRLVEEQHRRRVHEGPGDHHALDLAAREVVGPAVAPVGQAELLEQLVGQLLAPASVGTPW